MARMHTIIFISCIALLLVAFGTVAAQETTTASAPTETTAVAAPTTASGSSSEATYYGGVAGDRAVRIVSTEYVDGTAVFIFESDLPRAVTVTTSTGSTLTNAVARNLVHRPIPPGRTTIRVSSPEPQVTLVTSYSVENGRYTKIRSDDDDSALIAGSLAGTDVRDTAIGGALDTSFDALLVIVRRRFGLHRDMGRVV